MGVRSGIREIGTFLELHLNGSQVELGTFAHLLPMKLCAGLAQGLMNCGASNAAPLTRIQRFELRSRLLRWAKAATPVTCDEPRSRHRPSHRARSLASDSARGVGNSYVCPLGLAAGDAKRPAVRFLRSFHGASLSMWSRFTGLACGTGRCDEPDHWPVLSSKVFCLSKCGTQRPHWRFASCPEQLVGDIRR